MPQELVHARQRRKPFTRYVNGISRTLQRAAPTRIIRTIQIASAMNTIKERTGNEKDTLTPACRKRLQHLIHTRMRAQRSHQHIATVTYGKRIPQSEIRKVLGTFCAMPYQHKGTTRLLWIARIQDGREHPNRPHIDKQRSRKMNSLKARAHILNSPLHQAI